MRGSFNDFDQDIRFSYIFTLFSDPSFSAQIQYGDLLVGFERAPADKIAEMRQQWGIFPGDIIPVVWIRNVEAFLSSLWKLRDISSDL